MISSQGFPDHPHRGQATITYMLEGASRHEDSEGHKGIIEAGGVQWMTAGRGIIHAEMPVHAPGQPEPRGLQLWVDLPKEVLVWLMHLVNELLINTIIAQNGQAKYVLDSEYAANL